MTETASSSPRPPLTGLRAWRSAGGVVALVVIAAQVVWRGAILLAGFFTQDDFLVQTRSAEGPLDADLLSSGFAGGLSPGGNLTAWLEVSAWPMHWGWVAVVAILLQAIAACLCWMVLSRLLGDRWVRLPLLAIFCFTPLTLWTTQSWALSLEFLPGAVLLLLAVWALLARTQDRWRWGTAVAVTSSGLALAFDERAILFPVVLSGVALAVSDTRGVRKRIRVVARQHVALWVSLIVLTSAYLVVLQQSDAASPGWPSDWSRVPEVASAYWRHLVPGLLGGPWVAENPVDMSEVSAYWPGALGVALLLLMLGVLFQLGGRSILWALVPLVGLMLGILVLVVLSTSGAKEVALGRIPRAAADVVPAFVVLLGAALGGVGLPQSRSTGVLARVHPDVRDMVLAVAATAAFVASAAYTTGLTAPALRNDDDHEYVDNVRAALREDPQVVLFDGAVPEGVMTRWFGADARVSTVVGLVPEQPVFELPSEKLRSVGPDGSLAPVTLMQPVEMVPSGNKACGYPVTLEPSTIPLKSRASPGRLVLRIGYYTNSEGYAQVDVSGSSTRIPIRSGLHAIDLVVEGGFHEVQMSLEQDNATVCVAALSAGAPASAEP
jgi:hypothetical protein